MPAERVGALLHCPWHAVRTRQPIEVTIGILSRMKTVVGIRLHSLMFSAGQGVPVVGMSYDIKVDGFLKYIGSRTCLQLSSVKAEPLCRLIDECVSGALDNEVHRTAEMLRERESENVKGAAKLLNISENLNRRAGVPSPRRLYHLHTADHGGLRAAALRYMIKQSTKGVI